ncbi:MAG TPA: hypothetical protein VF046_06770 [Gemmatimonadales bacterium]
MLRRFGRVDRGLAVLLGLVWCAAGAVGLAIGVRRPTWPLVVLGPAAVLYGTLFLRAAWLGRPLRWPGVSSAQRPGRR